MELYFNDKTYKLNLVTLYESFNNDVLNEEETLSNNNSEKSNADVIEQNKNNKNFINGLIDIIGGESNTLDASNNGVDYLKTIDNLSSLEKLITSFKLL